MTLAATPTGPRRAALVFVFVTVLLDMLALGMIIPVLPRLIEGFVGNSAERAAHVLGVFSTVWAFMQFFAGPLLGTLSDRFGRRPVVLLSNLGLGLDYVLTAIAPSLGWMFVARVISGITAASVTVAGAYIADVTPPEKRAGAFGMLGAAFGVGFVLGPALGGLLGNGDPRLPFRVAAGLSLLNFAYGVLVLPESLAREKRSAFTWRRANPIGAFALLRSQRSLVGMAWVSFVGQLAHVALPTVFVLYANYRFGWSEREVGLTLAGIGICSVIVQAGLTRPIVARLGERRSLLVGMLFGAMGFTIYGLASRPWVFGLGVPVMALWGLAMPATQGIMSRGVPDEAQGRLQGALTSIAGVADILGPSLFTTVFAWAVHGRLHGAHDLAGAPFILSAALTLLGGAIGWFVTRRA